MSKNKDKEKKTQALRSKFEEVEEFLLSLYDFRFNTVTVSVEYKKKEEDRYSELNEHNIFRLLQHNKIFFPINNLKSLLCSDFVPEYDPFLEYFEGLPPWDGVDHIGKLVSYIKAKEPERFAYHLKKMFVRIVFCAIDENYFNKHAIILIGKRHNSGKSTLCRWLCPPSMSSYITETIDKDKDSLIALSENLIINLDELAVFNKKEISVLKTMLSKDRIKVRHPFGSRSIVTPRRASFIGSTNDDDFLTDATGSARWLCFEINSIDWDYSKDIDINKVYSQAYHLLKEKFICNLTGEDIESNEEVNQKYQKNTVEFEIIQRYFQPGKVEDQDDFYTTTELMEKIKSLTGNAFTFRLDYIGKALTQLGFDKSSKRRKDKKPVWGYYCIETIPSNDNEFQKEVTTVTTKEKEVSECLPF